jgi:hypothetical protein
VEHSRQVLVDCHTNINFLLGILSGAYPAIQYHAFPFWDEAKTEIVCIGWPNMDYRHIFILYNCISGNQAFRFIELRNNPGIRVYVSFFINFRLFILSMSIASILA